MGPCAISRCRARLLGRPGRSLTAVFAAWAVTGCGTAFADTPGTNLIVTPNTSLSPAGQTVAVSGTGFGPSGTGTIQQCIQLDAFTESCSNNVGTFVTAANGLFGPVNVAVTATVNGVTCSGATPCSLFAQMDAQPQNAHESISFGAPLLPALPAVVSASANFGLRDALTTGPATATFTYGARPQVPIMGDWDGDGTRTPGRFVNGVFHLNNQNDGSAAEITFTFGDPRGFPVVGDFNGDRVDDVAVVRNGLWQVRLSTGTTSSFTFGSGSWPATIPLAGDWNGDGTDGIGTYTYSTATWALRGTASAGAADAGTFVYGTPNASYPVPGDWDADGDDNVGVKTGATWALRNATAPGAPDITFDFGAANDLPLTWKRTGS